MINPIWLPSKDRIEQANFANYYRFLAKNYNLNFANYQELYSWSINSPDLFWESIWHFSNILASRNYDEILVNREDMLKAKWFVGSRLNFAQNCLKERSKKLALISYKENGEKSELTYNELYNAVAKCAQFLINNDVIEGDVVVAVLPNCNEAIIAMLATASIGAIWASCSPDFGLDGIKERFGQLEPKILFLSDGYYFKGQVINCLEKNKQLSIKIKSLRKSILVDYCSLKETEGFLTWSEIMTAEAHTLNFKQLDFNSPLYIMFSSGTTGKPKCIVHSVGGTLIQHLKELILHTDLSKEDKFFYYTTCGWMMWNWWVSGLAIGATLVCYDGSPCYPKIDSLFNIIEKEKINIFGTSASFLNTLRQENINIASNFKLSSLKTILSTGSPLSSENFDYVYQNIKQDICLASISGGTDIISCFALGNPQLPIYSGQLQCIGLGMAVNFVDEQGNKAKNQKGELTCWQPFPSMPIYFWQDKDKLKYKKSYFSKLKNVWFHGDFGELTPQNGVIIYGRSDAVLNPSGVRIGTSEIYRQVEKISAVKESLAVGINKYDKEQIILFVVLKEGFDLTEYLIKHIKKTIKNGASPRHVPAEIIQAAQLPKTRNGKLCELAVKKILQGEEINNTEAIVNPDALGFFRWFFLSFSKQ